MLAGTSVNRIELFYISLLLQVNEVLKMLLLWDEGTSRMGMRGEFKVYSQNQLLSVLAKTIEGANIDQVHLCDKY